MHSAWTKIDNAVHISSGAAQNQQSAPAAPEVHIFKLHLINPIERAPQREDVKRIQDHESRQSQLSCHIHYTYRPLTGRTRWPWMGTPKSTLGAPHSRPYTSLISWVARHSEVGFQSTKLANSGRAFLAIESRALPQAIILRNSSSRGRALARMLGSDRRLKTDWLTGWQAGWRGRAVPACTAWN